jgi:hypothetical protein
MPPVRWTAILSGVAFAAVIAVISAALLPPIPAAAASFLGISLCGFLAGKLASAARAYQGALVGVGYVLCEVVGLVPGVGPSADALSDTVLVIVSDALVIAAAALGGWAAQLSSSSDTGTDRRPDR